MAHHPRFREWTEVERRQSAAKAAYEFMNMVACSDCGLPWPDGYVHFDCPGPLPVPDIHLPDTECPCGDSVHMPVGVLIEFEGQKVRLVNWADYQGWEVRRAEANAPTLGYITWVLGSASETTYTATRPSHGAVGGFKRIDETLRHLLAYG